MTDNGIYYKHPLLKKMRIADIIKHAAEISKYSTEAIKGHSRVRPLVRVRFAIFTIAREMGYTYPHIARHIDKRDHTTIIYGCQQSAILQEIDHDFNSFIIRLRKAVSEHVPNLLNDNIKETVFIPEKHVTIKSAKYFWDEEQQEVMVA